jgi:polyhydroxyalkanoate depolymerase
LLLYETYQAQRDLTAPARTWATIANNSLGELPSEWTNNQLARWFSAGNTMISRAHLTHEQPPFGIDAVNVGRRLVPVHEETALSTPFSTLTHFVKETAHPQPKVLLVTALAGHFSTLLRSTVRSLLSDHDVYVTNWRNARDVDVAHGPFGLDDYIAQIIMFLEEIGPRTHLMAVCQPCPASLAAASIMAEDANPAQPKSIVLMAGPVDTSVSPTEVNDLAHSKPISWFEENVIATVPHRYEGAGRRVYPGFLQVGAFVSMNLGNHVRQHLALYNDLARGDYDATKAKMDFYDEYFAVLDIAADFYLETVERVFQRELLARGELTWRGRAVDPSAIRKAALLTVEGAKDDICGVGQTMAAQELCSGIRSTRKQHLLQPGVGHYGVFSGSKWESQIYPVVRDFILAND